MTKRFEILKGLPATGPKYITINDPRSYASNFTEGFVIRFFKNNGTDWIANFKTGIGNLNDVFELKESANLLVIAGGTCYIMNPDSAEPFEVWGGSYENFLITPKEKIILQNPFELTIVEPDGQHWNSKSISLEGICNISIQDDVVSGLAFTAYSANPSWTPFSYNLITNEMKYTNKKQWWKFW